MGKLEIFKKDISVNPRKLLVFAQPKVGKTTLANQLPDSLLIDTEDGSNYIAGNVFNLIEQAKKENLNKDDMLKKLIDQLSGEGVRFKFIVIDTITGLESIARERATKLYKRSSMGKNYTGRDVVSELAAGSGYMWLRLAFEDLYNLFLGLSDYLVLLGHFKQSSINKDGKDLTAKDIALTGKLKEIVSSSVDGVGFMYRNKSTNQNILSFKTNEQDLITGCRSKHLSGREFIISEMIDGELKTYWKEIFLNEGL